MYYKLEEGKLVGFYEKAQEEGTFVEISIEEWNDILSRQSQGETIYFNTKDEKLETILLGQFEELVDGIAVYKKDKEVDYNNNQLIYLRKRYSELKIAKVDSEELGLDTTDIDIEIADIKAQVAKTQAGVKKLRAKKLGD